jgi:hypothetical protein
MFMKKLKDTLYKPKSKLHCKLLTTLDLASPWLILLKESPTCTFLLTLLLMLLCLTLLEMEVKCGTKTINSNKSNVLSLTDVIPPCIKPLSKTAKLMDNLIIPPLDTFPMLVWWLKKLKNMVLMIKLLKSHKPVPLLLKMLTETPFSHMMLK